MKNTGGSVAYGVPYVQLCCVWYGFYNSCPLSCWSALIPRTYWEKQNSGAYEQTTIMPCVQHMVIKVLSDVMPKCNATRTRLFEP